MSFATGYRGQVGGSVQTQYADQPTVGIPGMMGFASGISLIDAIYIGEPGGIAAGRGVVFENVDDAISLQRPNIKAMLPDAGTIISDWGGIVVFDSQMQSNSDGVPGWSEGRIGRVLMVGRIGGRIYVNSPIDIDHTTDDVYMQILIDPAGVFKIGEFGNSTNNTTAILLTNAKWITSTEAGRVALIEIFLAV